MGTHVPVTVKEIQAGYLISPYFKDIYLYLAQNKLPSTKTTIHKVEKLAEKIYITRFIIIQVGHHARKGNSIISYTRDMCR